MKLKTHPDFPEKKEYNAARLTLRYIQAFNQARDEIGELNLELDIEKVKKQCHHYFFIDYYKNRAADSGLDSDRAIYEERESNARTLANAIVKAFDKREITK